MGNKKPPLEAVVRELQKVGQGLVVNGVVGEVHKR